MPSILRSLVAVLFLASAVQAAEPAIPQPLAPWVPWVLDESATHACALRPSATAATAATARLCAWPGLLSLELDYAGGTFLQRWWLQAPGWVVLPGSTDHWPQDVRSGDTPLPVLMQAGRPSVHLDAGEHILSGRFAWRQMPRALALAPQTVSVALEREGVPVSNLRIEPDGRLWLAEAVRAHGDGDRLSLEVYRRIDDDLPLRVTTRLELEVAGNARLARLAPVLLDGAVALALDSPLPARLDADGALLVQVRPGSWTISLDAQHPGDVTVLTRPQASDPWPETEVWSFAAQPDLRQVDPQGLEAVDPGQSGVPTEWQRLPAYQAGPGATLNLTLMRRGDPDPGPDRLSLQRDWWLDFEGQGASVRDQLTGELTRSWRLALGKPLTVGQVRVDGSPRLITQLHPDGAPGVEVRRGTLALEADSRFAGTLHALPVSGWDVELSEARARLHLPPGWDLLAVSGSDQPPASWIARWTLLDVFLVLILGLGVSRLWGPGWGLVALAAMLLTWQEPGAPRLLWLHLLAAAALLKGLPERLRGHSLAGVRRAAVWYRRLALAGLVVIGLPFLALQVGQGIWPQLEHPRHALDGQPGAPLPHQTQANAPYVFAELASRAPSADNLKVYKQAAIDPTAKVQAGPGMPVWSWSVFELSWRGPVAPQEQVQLWLRSPTWGLAWALAAAALALALAARMARVPRAPPHNPKARPSALDRDSERVLDSSDPGLVRGLAPLVLLAGALALGVGDARASEPPALTPSAFPTEGLLAQLRERLLRPPTCLPECVSLPRLSLTANPNTLVIEMILDVGAEVAAPVPGRAGGWIPESLVLDDVPLDALQRDEDGRLLVPLTPGQHRLVIGGRLPARGQVEIPFPLLPRHAEVSLSGWTLEGLDAAGRPGAQIRLVRLAPSGQSADAPLEQAALPPLLRVERTLRLGLDWRVTTRVRRLSPPEHPVVQSVPLLPGESVQSEGVSVRAGAALASLAPGQAEAVWESTLDPVSEILLEASTDPALAEHWVLDVSPRWNLHWSGPPPIGQRSSARDTWLPTWRPLPGEQLTLTVRRPAALPGAGASIERAALIDRPARRGGTTRLELRVRATQGGMHRVALPSGAVVLRVEVDGAERPLPGPDEPLEISLAPGLQEIAVDWRGPEPLTTRYSPLAPALGQEAANLVVQVDLPRDRWVLAAWGPIVGPVVMVWVAVPVLLVLAWWLAHGRRTPLRTADWLLLGLGLATVEPWAALVVAAWLLALGARARLDAETPRGRFNLIQVGLLALTLLALLMLAATVSQGLLGRPDMHVLGNGSSAQHLRWYQDRGTVFPDVGVVSVPLWVYRLAMLAWALWLAGRLIRWLRWGFEVITTPAAWRPGTPKV